VAAWLTREEAGRLLAPLCKAGAAVVRGADAVEDAGQAEIWLGGRPMWGIARVNARIDERWADGLPGLAHVLKTLTVMIHNLLEVEDIEVVFDRLQTRRQSGERTGLSLDAGAGRDAFPVEYGGLGATHAPRGVGSSDRAPLRIRKQAHASDTVRAESRNLLHVLGLRANYNIGNKQYSSKNLSYCPIHSCLVLVTILRSD
jgi:hypothetical protein